MECVLDESATDEAECNSKVARGGRVAVAIQSLVKARSLQLECVRAQQQAPAMTHASNYWCLFLRMIVRQ